jgi:hypothetical protein
MQIAKNAKYFIINSCFEVKNLLYFYLGKFNIRRMMWKPRILFHCETFPENFVEGLNLSGFECRVSNGQLTLEQLDENECVAIMNSSDLTQEEIDAVLEYNKKGGGVFVLSRPLNESHHERLWGMKYLLRQLFDTDLRSKRVLPILEYETTASEGTFEKILRIISSEKPRKVIERIPTSRLDIEVKIRLILQSYIPTIKKYSLELDEDDIGYISAFDYSDNVRSRLVFGRIVKSNISGYEGTKIILDKVNFELATNPYSYVGIVGMPIGNGRSFALSTSTPFTEIEKNGPKAKLCQEILKEIMSWLCERYRGERHEEVLEEIPLPPPHPEYLTSPQEKITEVEKPSLEKKIEKIEKMLMEWKPSNEVVLELYNLSAEIIRSYNDLDMGKEIIKMCEEIENSVPPQRNFKEQDFLIYEIRIKQTLNKVRSKSEWYREHIKT